MMKKYQYYLVFLILKSVIQMWKIDSAVNIILRAVTSQCSRKCTTPPECRLTRKVQSQLSTKNQNPVRKLPSKSLCVPFKFVLVARNPVLVASSSVGKFFPLLITLDDHCVLFVTCNFNKMCTIPCINPFQTAYVKNTKPYNATF